MTNEKTCSYCLQRPPVRVDDDGDSICEHCAEPLPEGEDHG